MIRFIAQKTKLTRNIVNPFCIHFPQVQLLQRSTFGFAKIKKQKPSLKVPTIHISKFNEQKDGFILYQNQEGGRFKILSLGFLAYFLWGYWTYSQIEDDQIKVNYLIMGGLMVIPFLILQFRINKTLKGLTMDKQGQNVILTRFHTGGFGEETTKTRVQVLKGIGKAFVFGGSVIKGGGVYGLQQRNYWFQSKFIRQPLIFEEVAQGNRIKIQRTKTF